MDPMTIAAVAQGVVGLAQGVQGAIQKGKANRIMRSNPRPRYDIPTQIEDNNRIAESRAGQGLSAAAMSAYTSGVDRGTTASIDAILKNGGSSNNIADVYGSMVGGYKNLAMLDEQMRVNNLKMFTDSNNQLADYEDKAWQINEYAPYADKAQTAAALSKQGSDNLWKGVNTGVGAVANYATGKMYQNEADRVFSSNERSYTQTPPEAPKVSQEQQVISSLKSTFPGLIYGRYKSTGDENYSGNDYNYYKDTGEMPQ